MNASPANTTTPPPAVQSAPKPAPKRRRWWLLGCGGMLGILLIIVVTVIITIWWMGRPITPVVLSAAEKQAVEQKLEQLSHSSTNSSRDLASTKAQIAEPDRVYTPGSRELRLTEREINGLLHENTDLGDCVRLEFGRNAINAYIAKPIPEDVPVLGGHMFRAKGRFKLSIGNGGEPYAMLEDITVFGLSLPKAWLGGIKGENLLKDAMSGEGTNKPALQGIKSLRVEPGALVLEVDE